MALYSTDIIPDLLNSQSSNVGDIRLIKETSIKSRIMELNKKDNINRNSEAIIRAK